MKCYDICQFGPKRFFIFFKNFIEGSKIFKWEFKICTFIFSSYKWFGFLNYYCTLDFVLYHIVENKYDLYKC